MLNFCILGPLEVRNGDRIVKLGGPLQNRLLLTLLINAGELVVTDSLIGEIWPHGAPDRVENALQAHVSRLRRRLAALEGEAVERRLITHTSGYQLMVAPEELDSEIFVRELERVRETRTRSSDVAARDLRVCLSRWRGPVLGGVRGGPICMAATARYEELQLESMELMFDLELANGRHTQLVPELRQALARHPFHERFHQQIIIALYRCGRQAEALAAYRRLWDRLTDELGLEPTPAMREYERAILEGDTGPDFTVLAHM